MAHLLRQFRTRSWVSYKNNPIAADFIVFGIISGDFLFYIDKVCQWGDSNDNIEHTFM